MTNTIICTECNERAVFRFTVCKECFYKIYCSFCRSLVKKEDCKGHSVVLPTTNRFMEESQFTSELMFDIEQ